MGRGLCHPSRRKGKGVSVVMAQAKHAKILRRPVPQKILRHPPSKPYISRIINYPDRNAIAQGFGHFGRAQGQVPGVHKKGAPDGRAPRGGLALRNLIFMVGKLKIHAPTMQINCIAKDRMDCDKDPSPR